MELSWLGGKIQLTILNISTRNCSFGFRRIMPDILNYPGYPGKNDIMIMIILFNLKTILSTLYIFIKKVKTKSVFIK